MLVKRDKITRRNMTSRWFVFMCLFGLSSTGCSQGGLPNMIPIEGKVIYNGEPLKFGYVAYVPVDKVNGRTAKGVIQPDGTFRMTTLKMNDGVQIGDYTIAVVAQPLSGTGLNPDGTRLAPGALVTPVKYAHDLQSGLTDNVDADHSGYKELILTDE